MCLGLVSIPEYETEILVTLNTPLKLNPQSSSACYEEAPGEEAALEKLSLKDDKEEKEEGRACAAAAASNQSKEEEHFGLFQAMLRSFRVVDYRLFGHG